LNKCEEKYGRNLSYASLEPVNTTQGLEKLTSLWNFL